MNNFFATPEGGWGDGSVHLTTVGIAIVIAVIALLLIVAAIVRHKNATHKSALTTKQLVYSAVAIALAVVCSMIKLFDMPMGGSVTLLSMLFIVLIAYWYGPYVGIMTAVAYGLVQFVLEPIFYTIPQMLLDYPLAFGALGLAGFFNKKKWGLQIGYIAGVIGRFVFATISGVVFFAAYAPEGMSRWHILPAIRHPTLFRSNHHLDYYLHSAGITCTCGSPQTRRRSVGSAIKRTAAPALCTLKRDMFYYKNIGEYEVPECNQRRQFFEAKSEDSSVPRRTSSSVSFHVWTVPGACPTKHRQ